MASDPLAPDPLPAQDPLRDRRYNARLGLFLFAVYLALYLGFVLVNAFAPEQMETIVLAGLNLAIAYGFGLILAALLLALLYGWLCRPDTSGGSTTGGSMAGASGPERGETS